MSGKLYLVSVGPGFSDLIPPLAKKVIEDSDTIVAYELYLKWIQEWVEGKDIHIPPLTKERERAEIAIKLARQGKKVSLISSGDIGIYAMATLAFDLMEEDDTFDVQVIPGISAANSCASLLGAPLSHDYATLSLSDLLCPWEWIEKRASHIAQADLAVVFYNVQSRSRQEGVYRILEIMLEHKSPETWCGIVRNAYREDQEIQLIQLKDLPKQKFDMLTSLVIGNRFTEKKGKFIFTPRGYVGWNEQEQEKEIFPEGSAWVFSGTSDGNALADEIAKQGKQVIVSAATDYGQEVVKRNYPHLYATGGRKGVEARRQELRDSKATHLVDATHPFATEITSQLIGLAEDLDIPYYRYERASSCVVDENVSLVATMEDAGKLAASKGKNVFLATGSKELRVFTKMETDTKWFVRLTPDPKMVQRAMDAGIPRTQTCGMQGPFSKEFNLALWKQWNIDCVITKDSGNAGGYEDKKQACDELGIPLIVITRPEIPYPKVASSVGEICKLIQD
jgi:precorrin-6x reductase